MNPDQTAPSSLIRVHTVCLYAKKKKNRFEKSARKFSRRHKQTTFSDAVFLGALRVNDDENLGHVLLATKLSNYLLCFLYHSQQYCPAATQHLDNVASTSVQRHAVASTLYKRCVAAGQ